MEDPSIFYFNVTKVGTDYRCEATTCVTQLGVFVMVGKPYTVRMQLFDL